MELVMMMGLFMWIMARISPEFKKQLVKMVRGFGEFLRG